MNRFKGGVVVIVLLSAVFLIWLSSVAEQNKIKTLKDTKLHEVARESPEMKKSIQIAVKTVTSDKKAKKKHLKKKTSFVKRKTTTKKDPHADAFEPDLFADYEMPVNEYLEFMTDRGAKVLVYDTFKTNFVCEVINNKIIKTSSAAKYDTDQLRRMTDDFPRGNEILQKVQLDFGIGNYEILLAVPDYLYNVLKDKIYRAVIAKGINARDIVTVFVVYKGSASSITVHVEEVSGEFGVRPIKTNFML